MVVTLREAKELLSPTSLTVDESKVEKGIVEWFDDTGTVVVVWNASVVPWGGRLQFVAEIASKEQ